MTRAITRWMVALCTLAACASDDALDADGGGDAATHDAQDANAAEPGALRDAVGAFAIELMPAVLATETADAAPAYAQVSGRVRVAAVPAMERWDLLTAEGDCQLFKRRLPFCDPACARGMTCTEDDSCAISTPDSLDVGAVTLTGVRTEPEADELVLTPLTAAFVYQPSAGAKLAFPPFDAGDEVTLHAQGGAFAPFERSALGIAPLELLSALPLPFGDEPTQLRWTPAEDPTASRVVVRFDISHHGGQKGEIVCETDDDGELELPVAVADGLIALGVAGFPDFELSRTSISEPAADAPGVVLQLTTAIHGPLAIAGIMSCTPGGEDVCPEGQTCLSTHLCGE